MNASPLVEAVDLEKRFPLTRTASEYFAGKPGRAIHAVDGVSLTIFPGETLGLIGESGSGKTTFGWMLARLHDATDGTYRFGGEELHDLRGPGVWRDEVRRERRRVRQRNRLARRENRRRRRQNRRTAGEGQGPPVVPGATPTAGAASSGPLELVPLQPLPPMPPRSKALARRLRRWRRNVQIVFQDPVGSLDPRLKVWQLVGEPIRAQNEIERTERRRIREENRDRQRENRRRLRQNHRIEAEAQGLRRGGRPTDGSNPPPERPLPPLPMEPLPPPRPRLTAAEVRRRVRALLPTVGLPADCLDQYPHEFSGGGRQRISLARAFSVEPRLVILDEPTSALDVAVQAQILNRLVEYQRGRPVAYLLISHNVAAVRYVADRVAVMYLGRIVELGSVRSVLEHPIHPYTKALLAAVPAPDARRRRARFRIGGDVPSLIDLPPGCRFAPRCPFVIDRCRSEYPPLREIPAAPGQLASCHRAEEVRDVVPESLLTTESTPPARSASP